MNIQTIAQYTQAVQKLDEATIVSVDTETNTLRIRQTEKPLVSIQIYLPEFDLSFNFPFRQGQGELDYKQGFPLTFTSEDPELTYKQALKDYLEESWANRDKTTFLLAEIYEDFTSENMEWLGNLPIELFDDLKTHFTPDKTYVFHNANFDLTVLEREGFAPMPNIIDTMIALQVVWGDWGGKRSKDEQGIKVTMPKRYRDPDSEKEWGNRRLKWQARFWDLDNADLGEKELDNGITSTMLELAEYAVKRAENGDTHYLDLLSGISYATWRKNPLATDKDGITWHDRQVQRVVKKISFNVTERKSRLWMLPSSATTVYGEMDVILTWQLWEKCRDIIEAWGDMPIFEELSWINTTLAWRMTQNGVLINVEDARRRIADNELEMQAILDLYDWNIDSNKQMLDFLKMYGIKVDDVQAGTLRDLAEKLRKEQAMGSVKVVEAIEHRLEYKRIKKETSTYLLRWVEAVDEHGYGHFNIDVAGTKTGRATSGGDMGNGQNIPTRKSRVKEVIVAPAGKLLFGVDYSNLEARVCAWVAEVILGLDPNATMTTLVQEGEDLHSYTANMLDIRGLMYPNLTDVEIADKVGLVYTEEDNISELVWKEVLRQTGKTANFGLLYGGSVGMLNYLMGLNNYEIAEQLHSGWNNLFPAFALAQQHFEADGLYRRSTPSGKGANFQYTKTIVPLYKSEGKGITDYRYGRNIKHHLYERSRWVRDFKGDWQRIDPRLKSASKGWNNSIQGSCGQICLHSGARFYSEYDSTGVDLFVNIHDALDGYADVNHLRNVKTLMEVMEDWNTAPALEVELEAGFESWQSLKTVRDLDLWIDSKGREGYKKQ